MATQTVTDTSHWHWTTEQGRQHFDQEHADIPVEEWPGVDFDTWTNLHLKDAA